jgi:phosphoglycolate phosphatase-like HAD superfamily hydrolase
MTQLIVFDIDGTLTRTNDVDTRCYVQAMSEYLGVTIDDHWSRYRHVTDSGIATELFEMHGRPLADVNLVRQRFLSLLEEALREKPDCCREVADARDLLVKLRRMPGVAVGIATGGWADSAYAKLRHAGIDVEDLAFASADDCESRTEIMRLCEQRAAAMAKVQSFAAIGYVGDGEWDLRASRELGWNFVGIAEGDDAKRLRNAGAKHVFPDFLCDKFILEALSFA